MVVVFLSFLQTVVGRVGHKSVVEHHALDGVRFAAFAKFGFTACFYKFFGAGYIFPVNREHFRQFHLMSAFAVGLAFHKRGCRVCPAGAAKSLRNRVIVPYSCVFGRVGVVGLAVEVHHKRLIVRGIAFLAGDVLHYFLLHKSCWRCCIFCLVGLLRECRG